MALTYSEQLQLINGTITPPSGTFDLLVLQAAIDNLRVFLAGAKVVDPAISPDAQQYRNKIEQVARTILTSNNNRVVSQLTRIMASIIGDSAVTVAQMQAADDSQWSTFLDNNILAVLETMGNVLAQEKSEYDAL